MSRACTARRRPPSRACCSPPGAVSEGLRGFDPLGPGQSSRGWRGGRLGKGVLAEGPEPGAVREGSCGEPGAAWGWAGPPSLPPRLPASPERRAHLRRPEPCRPAAPGKVVVPGARRAQRCSGWDSGRKGRARPWTGEVTFPAPEPRLPGATSQTSDPFFLLLVCVPPARGSSGRCLFGSGSSIPSRDGCCGPGREDEFTAVEQVALEMECQRKPVIYRLGVVRWEVGLSFLLAFADSSLLGAEDCLLGQPGELGGGSGSVRWAPRFGRSRA